MPRTTPPKNSTMRNGGIFWGSRLPPHSGTAPAAGNGTIQSSGQRQNVQAAPAGQDSGDFREQISGILLQQKERLDAIESTSKNGMMILSSQLQSAN
ncbi:TPA: hypothetical protein ACKFHV_005499, partial [Klebsiella pneumoniae]